MYIYIIFAITVVLVAYFLITKNGSLSFWKKAAKNPDFVYQQLLTDNAWLVDDGSKHIDKGKYDGPFFLYVPNFGKTIKLYGEVGKYEDSQKQIETKL